MIATMLVENYGCDVNPVDLNGIAYPALHMYHHHARHHHARHRNDAFALRVPCRQLVIRSVRRSSPSFNIVIMITVASNPHAAPHFAPIFIFQQIFGIEKRECVVGRQLWLHSAPSC